MQCNGPCARDFASFYTGTALEHAQISRCCARFRKIEIIIRLIRSECVTLLGKGVTEGRSGQVRERAVQASLFPAVVLLQENTSH